MLRDYTQICNNRVLGAYVRVVRLTQTERESRVWSRSLYTYNLHLLYPTSP